MMKTHIPFQKLLNISLILVFFPFNYCRAQNLDVPYVPTPQEVVEQMLDISNVGPGDYVIDLGSGDGRIVIAAAERGAVGYGIDIDPRRIQEAKTNALQAGVADRVLFVEGDLFKADISNASVITMYLLSSVNLRLRPVLLSVLRPGTRIVSHSFSMGDWEADRHVRVGSRSVYYWVIPAPVQGTWQWSSNGEDFTMRVSQEFQKISLSVTSGNNTLAVRDPVLSGDRVSFIASDPANGNQYIFNGRVDNKLITGSSHILNGDTQIIENWVASLTNR